MATHKTRMLLRQPRSHWKRQHRMFSDTSLIRIVDGAAITPESLLTGWIKHHLYMLGYDKIKLFAYQKLSSLTNQVGGGTVKNVVFSVSAFVKEDLAKGNELLQHVYSHLDAKLKENESLIALVITESLKISGDSKWFYIAVGYMMLMEPEEKLQTLTNKVVDLYLDLAQGTGISLDKPIGKVEKQILKLASKYYRSVKINYKALYAPLLEGMPPRSICIGEDLSIQIPLPPLPQIKSKHLLAKALLHKELYRAVFLPNHSFHASLVKQNIEIDTLALKVVRYDLLFLDGLGDFFIATEASEFLYKFRYLDPFSADPTFGKKTYNLLKTILATNTLLLRLAIAYNLPHALEDDIVFRMLSESYIPHLTSQVEATGDDAAALKYEEEFVADYFEQYVGALYLEQPDVAKKWINSLFETILFLISDSYRVYHKKRKYLKFHFDYRAWSVDVIGRSI